MKNRIFLDLDGVMADFEGHFQSYFGTRHDSFSDFEMWRKIESYKTFFLDLPVMDGALEFFDSIKHLNPIILTACPKTSYNVSAIQKKQWVKMNLSKDILILPVLGGKNKALFMQNQGDILIDDFKKNCDSWTNYGGNAILHSNFVDTTKQLTNLMENNDG
jgi:5'(3')-deoxyribonucleotidase